MKKVAKRRSWRIANRLYYHLRSKKQDVSRLPKEFTANFRPKLVRALNATHGFKGNVISWGSSKKEGPVKVKFKPVQGYKSANFIDWHFKGEPPHRTFHKTGGIIGFSHLIGFAVRLGAFPTKAEFARFKSLGSLSKVEAGSDAVVDEINSLGNVGGIVTFVGKERKPTFLVVSLKIRKAYYRLPKELRRRYSGWMSQWLSETEKQCKRLGFARIGIVPSTDPYFSKRGVGLKPETRDALYKDLPEERGYKLEKLLLPTYFGRMEEIRFYTKKP